MSFTRIQYDNCAYAEKINNSQKSMYYKLYNGQSEQCKPCVASYGPRNNRLHHSSEITTVSRETPLDLGLITEVESLLSNRSYPNSRCMTTRTLEEKQNKLKNIKMGLTPVECDTLLRSSDTRLDLPVDNFRGIYVDRWEYPIINPVNWVYEWSEKEGNIQIGRNTKLGVRDMYKTQLPNPLPLTAMPQNYTD
jgi:hypothetical protein